MSATIEAKLHYSPALGKYMRCVAEESCPYGDAHTDVPGIATAGGGKAAPNGRTLTVSAMIDDAYTVGTENRTQTWTRDGRKLSPVEARRRRTELAKRATDTAPVNTAAKAPRVQSGAQSTNPRDFQLAEHSRDPGILARLAHSTDWSVRLFVSRNPATATDTLESLAVSTDKNARLYRNAAHEELSFRYQDMRDAAEQEACARMEADGVFQNQLQSMPSYRQLSYMPAKRWQQKTQRARRTLIEAAMDEAARLFKFTVRVAGWTTKKTVSVTLDQRGQRTVRLPRRVALFPSTHDIGWFMVEFFTTLAGDAADRSRVMRRLGYQPRAVA